MSNDFETLARKALATERRGNAVTPGMATNFPKHQPMRGMAYSKNFSRCLQNGSFAVQVKD
jgi:hypothetical protein